MPFTTGMQVVPICLNLRMPTCTILLKKQGRVGTDGIFASDAPAICVRMA